MSLQSRWRFEKEEVVGAGGVVAAKHPLAAEAGIEMLRVGGNAFDAAVAMGYATAVVEPMMTTIAGVGLMLAHEALTGDDWVVEYGPRAPKAARADMYEVLRPSSEGLGLYKVRDDANESGYLSATVPAAVEGLCRAHQRFGQLPLARVMEPAIHWAADGFTINWYLALHIGQSMDKLRLSPTGAALFLPGGLPLGFYPEPSRLVQPALAETLRRIASQGPAGFYEGEIAHAIEDDMREHGGLVTVEDLASYRAEIVPPFVASYRGHEILFPTSPCGAWTAVETLNILEAQDLSGAGHNSADRIHRLIESARLAFADRYYYLGDPDAQPVPLRGMLSKDYASALAARIDPSRASSVAGSGQPWAEYATKALNDPWPYDTASRPTISSAPSSPSSGDCTTHFCAMDAAGNAVSCTQTAVGSFGSGVMTEGVGAFYTNGMNWFNPVPGAVNSIAGWKRPLTNMTPLMVKRDGAVCLSLGASGGRKIMNCNTQVLLNVVDHGMGIQAAIAAPRMDASGRTVLVDARVEPEVLKELERRGHSIQPTEETPAMTSFATPVGIVRDPANGLLHGGVDVYRIAEARALP